MKDNKTNMKFPEDYPERLKAVSWTLGKIARTIRILEPKTRL